MIASYIKRYIQSNVSIRERDDISEGINLVFDLQHFITSIATDTITETSRKGKGTMTYDVFFT